MLAPTGARLSYLDGKHITDLCHKYESFGGKERSRNTVRRGLLRGISKMLTYHLGRKARSDIFLDVQYAAEDDTREVSLSADEIARLLDKAYKVDPEARVLIMVALQTSADRGSLLAGEHNYKTWRGLLSRDIRIWEVEGEDGQMRYEGEVFLQATKTDTRSRTVPLADMLCRELLPLVSRKHPDDPVFSIEYRKWDPIWYKIRRRAKLPRLQFRDLRAQVSQFGEEQGVAQTKLSRTMGHSGDKMIRRYQQRQTAVSSDEIERIAAAMFGKTG